jgi:uncharacterized membrane protein YdjX (TVP38/TMEM64 family)
MNTDSLNLKLIIGIAYILIISIALYFIFSFVDIKDLMNYEFIRSNQNAILKYKSENLFFLTFSFFIFSIIWVLFLGFAVPLLIFAGFVFGKWWGILIIITSTTIGATLLYILADFFFKDLIKKNLPSKFYKLRDFFVKNDIFYFTCFRLIGGGGAPYAIQNLLPILFNMSAKNYFIATFVGSAPSMFVTVAFGSGIEKVIDKNAELSIATVFASPDIYVPLIGFFIILLIAFVIKKYYFKQKNI